MAERSGFEPPVQILELIDDSSRSFKTGRGADRQANERPFRSRLYRPFFLYSAQRFFIASDNRFLPAAVRRPRLLLFAVGAEAAAFSFEVAAGESVPSSAAMARLSRSLSLFNSATILSKSKIRSSDGLHSAGRLHGFHPKIHERGDCFIQRAGRNPTTRRRRSRRTVNLSG